MSEPTKTVIWCAAEGCREHWHLPEGESRMVPSFAQGAVLVPKEDGGYEYMCSDHAEEVRVRIGGVIR